MNCSLRQHHSNGTHVRGNPELGSLPEDDVPTSWLEACYLVQSDNVTSSTLLTLLHRAIDEQLPDIVEYLLARGANPNGPDACGLTPIIRAVAIPNSSHQVCRALLLHGAYPSGNVLLTYPAQGPPPPIWCAALCGNDEIVALLAQYGADLSFVGSHGETLLHNIAAVGRLSTAKVLVQSGADPRSKSRDGSTPADFAADAFQDDMVNWLRGL